MTRLKKLQEQWNMSRLQAIDLSPFILLVLVGVILYHPTFAWLFKIWWSDREYSHGFIIPLVTLFLVWKKYPFLKNLTPKPAWMAGLLVIVTSGIFLLFGRAGGFTLAEAISLILLFPGIILFVWGWDHLKALALPIAYLQFMVPWTEEFISRIHWPFQLLSANLGVWLLKVFGFSVYQEDKYIQLPMAMLEVAQECSGVKFLTSVIALGIPLVYITQRSWWRGIGVVLSGVVITILANGVRVFLAGVMVNRYGPAMLHGPSHIFQGWFVAQVGFIALFLINWAVLKIPSRPGPKLYERWKGTYPDTSVVSVQSHCHRQVLVLSLFLIGMGGYLHLFGHPIPVQPKRTLFELPTEMGQWKGSNSAWLNGERYFPKADMEVVRTYRNNEGREVHLYIGYFETQRQGKSLVSHRMNAIRENAQEVPSNLGKDGPPFLNRSFPNIDKKKYAAIFWYRFPSMNMTGRYKVKIKTIVDAVIHRKNNGAIILMAVPIQYEGDKNIAEKDLLAFALAMTPELREYLQ